MEQARTRSTLMTEERMNSTETVLKNLIIHPSYYSGLIQYETQFRNDSSKPAFKAWLKSFYEDTKMIPIKEGVKKNLKENNLN